MKLHPDENRFRHTLAHALEAGARQTGPVSWAWDIAGRCVNPQGVELESRPAGRGRAGDIFVPQDGHPLILRLDVPCRRCEVCLAVRKRNWQERSRVELMLAPRTWFGTLTLSPDEHYAALSRARRRWDEQGITEASLAGSEIFRARCQAIGPEITRFLKRVRKNSGARYRYLVVTEAHKSGLPHFHGFFHEVSTEEPLRKKILNAAWQVGEIRKFKLVEDHGRAAHYVTKYLSKDILARVRASQSYGKRSITIVERGPMTQKSPSFSEVFLTDPVLDPEGV